MIRTPYAIEPNEAGWPTGHAGTPFAALLTTEIASAFGWRHAVGLVGLSLMGVLLAFWLPTLPDDFYRFFARVLAIEGWPAIVVANDFTGLFFFVYWFGVFDVIRIYVLPLEEGYLDIVLSKPLTRRAYMAARLAPMLLVATAIGVVAAAVHWLALLAAGLTYDLAAYAGAAAVIIAWAVCLVAFVNVLILRVRDSYSALLVAFVPAIVAMFPGIVYIYRPDVFDGAPALRDAMVFPTNLVWYPELAAQWGLTLAACLLALAVVFAALAGWSIERRDVR